MKDIQDYFMVGSEVNVTARPDDMFNHDFTGTVIGYKDEFVQVRDQDDDVWDCEPSQLEFNTDAIMHDNQ